MTTTETPRRECTQSDPYVPGKTNVFWYHPQSDDDGECSDSCCDYYKCRVCGLRFRVTGENP